MNSEVEAHLDAVLIGGWDRREIVLVDYDQEWPERFANNRRAHRGSTGQIPVLTIEKALERTKFRCSEVDVPSHSNAFIHSWRICLSATTDPGPIHDRRSIRLLAARGRRILLTPS